MKDRTPLKILSLLLAAGLLLAACAPVGREQASTEYVLTTGIRNGKFVFLGVNGSINGLVNPALHARPGEPVSILLVNSGEAPHDIVLPELNVRSDRVTRKGETTSITFIAPDGDQALSYYDSGYRKLGMQGLLLVGNVADPGQAFAAAHQEQAASAAQPTPGQAEAGASGPEPQAASTSQSQAAPAVLVEYTLETGLSEGRMVYFGRGGEIDGQVNPDLTAAAGDTVRIILISGEGVQHNIFFEAHDALSPDVSGKGSQVELTFTAGQAGETPYYCTIPGHRQAGMEGRFIVTPGEGAAAEPAAAGEQTAAQDAPPEAAAVGQPPEPGPAAEDAVDIVRDPTDLPAPLGPRGPETVRVDLETVELSGVLADGTTYTYWTFNGKVPGPFIRIRVGDTVEVHLKNDPESMMPHSVDFHAVTGPGGGAVATQTPPGEETTFTFQALNPGLYVYHCATPMVAHHIANGMYGLILVEPEGGLPAVDREFYIMQGELYTAQPFGTAGHLAEDVDKLLNEDPEYFVFNGSALALASDAHALHASTGETVRIYFGVGGPNFTSSFHVIGEIFDRVYDQASLTAAPLTDVQTTLVPPGGATVVEFGLQVPGRYILVDHALARLERGLAGFLYVDGDPVPEIFNGEPTAGSGH